MHRTPDGQLAFSPSDLTEFMESRFASWMSRYLLDHPEAKPEQDASSQLLMRLGIEHEQRVLVRLRDELGLDVAEIDAAGSREEQHRQTLEAIESGRDVVYQARLELAPFAGQADFLVHPRVAARASGQGQVHGATQAEREGTGNGAYEVWDAKLTHRAKPDHLVQLCAYAEMLEAVQGARPEELVLVLGTGERARFRVEDHLYYYRSLRQAFLEAMETWDEDARPIPDSGRKHRRWQQAAEGVLEEIDHTSLVARITKAQVEKLSRAGIETLAQLAELADTDDRRVSGISPPVLARLGEQARLQRVSSGEARPRYRVLEPDEVQPGRGLASLPAASAGDVFFDIEGYPLAEGGLEYLWGVAYHREDGGGPPTDLASGDYRAFWAHDAEQELRVFEVFIDWVIERRTRFPELHVYHYAPYETTAIKRIMGRSGSREREVNELLVGNVFVDLYQIVRHALRIGEPSYSIKNVERLYRDAREGEVTSGLGSVVEYEVWMQSGEPRDPAASPRLEAIRRYNEDDCVSTLELAAWLRERQREGQISYEPPQRAPQDEKKMEERQARQEARRELVEKLKADPAEGPVDGSAAEPPGDGDEPPAPRTGLLLAQLAEFHAREAKPVWWELFERASITEEERAEQPDCLAGIERTARPPFSIARSKGFEYAFDPEQDTKIRQGSTCRVAQDWPLSVEVAELDATEGRLVLKLSDARLAKSALGAVPQRLCLIRFEYRDTRIIEESIEATAQAWLGEHELRPALDGYLAHRRSRVIGDESVGPLRPADEPLPDALQRIVGALDRSTLCVQGPPGSGKTTLGARAICNLAAEGKVVAITSNSHKAIANLMSACGAEARRRGTSAQLLKVGSKPEDCEVPGEPDARRCKSADVATLLVPGTIVGATAWCFSRPDLDDRFDHLFVDEAGQVSLANLVATSRCAENVVLLGDPAQLAQPLRGVHPGDSGRSALEYVLPPGHSVIGEQQGLFLEDTHRLHPEICSYISDTFYEGKLHPAPGNERRVLLPEPGGDASSGPQAGIVFVPVEHRGNRQASHEEVRAIGGLFGELLGRRFRQRDHAGEQEGEITLDDILVVAPYNLQVGRLQASLPEGARIGSVDKFQGQQAPIVILSMCASDGTAAPRGVEFLLSPNRVNVAVSRAQCLAIVVGSPRIAQTPCATVRDMKLVNSFCRIVLEGQAWPPRQQHSADPTTNRTRGPV